MKDKRLVIRNMGSFYFYSMFLLALSLVGVGRSLWIGSQIIDISQYELSFGFENVFKSVFVIYLLDRVLFLALVFTLVVFLLFCLMYFIHSFVFDQDEVSGTINWAYYGKRASVKYLDIQEFGKDEKGRFYIKSSVVTLVTADKVSAKNIERMELFLRSKTDRKTQIEWGNKERST